MSGVSSFWEISKDSLFLAPRLSEMLTVNEETYFHLLYPVAADCGKHVKIICSFWYIVIKLNCKYGLFMVLLLILDG